MSKFTMSNKMRKQIAKRGLYAMTSEKMSPVPKITLIVGIILLIVGGIWLIVAGYPTDSDEFLEIAGLFGIPGVILALNGLFDFIISRRRFNARKQGLELLELQYGQPAKTILAEIDQQINTYQGEIPATNGFDAKKRGFFTAEWYIAPELTRFVKLKDIACVANMDTAHTKAVVAKGVYLITTMREDDAINDFFGNSGNTNTLVDLIKQANPTILTENSKININGKELTIFDALRFVTSDTPLVEDSTRLKRERRAVMDVIIATWSDLNE